MVVICRRLVGGGLRTPSDAHVGAIDPWPVDYSETRTDRGVHDRVACVRRTYRPIRVLEKSGGG